MNRKQAFFLVLVVILLAVIGLIAWYFLTPRTAIAPTTASSTAANTATSAPLQTDAPASHIIQNGQYFTIDLQYPSATPLTQTDNSAANAAAVALLKNYSQQTASTFITDADIA